MIIRFWFCSGVLLCSLVLCCEGKSEHPAAALVPTAPEPARPEHAAPAAASSPHEEPSALEAPTDPDEACGQIIVVSYRGATYATPGVTRDKEAARARAQELWLKARGLRDMSELAKAESDAPSSAPRGGIMGTFRKAEWPPLHAALRDVIFTLQVHETAPVIEAPYGFVIARRCKVEKAESRHVLIRYAGATNAGSKVKRTKDEAHRLALQVRQSLIDHASFADIAKKHSEDASRARGGNVGVLGRGRLAPEYEAALFALQPGEMSPVVETEYGFHVIQRLPEAPLAPAAKSP